MAQCGACVKRVSVKNGALPLARKPGHTLAQVPENVDPPSIGEQLADALETASVSQNELARRLAKLDGTQSESKRRWLLKVLRDDLDAPDMSEIEVALSLPRGHFVLPTAQQVQRRRVRLEELEAEVARLRDELDRFVRSASERRAEIEKDQAPPTHQEARPSSQDES